MPDCKPCSQNGITVPAMYMVNGVPKCEACKRNQDAPPVSLPPLEVVPRELEKREEKTAVSKEIDWSKVQEERSKGVAVGNLAMKYDVTTATIYNRTKAAKNGAKPKAAPKSKRAAYDGSNLDALLDDLKSKREEIDKAIEAVEAVRGLLQ
jgi:hypothetical protein